MEENFVDLQKGPLPEPVFVTAFSRNRFFQAKHLVSNSFANFDRYHDF